MFRESRIEIVGNGTGANAKSNARTLDWSGNETLAGGITLGKGTANETSLTAAELADIKSGSALQAPPTTEGTYMLRATVSQSGEVTYEWVAMSVWQAGSY